MIVGFRLDHFVNIGLGISEGLLVKVIKVTVKDFLHGMH